MSNARRPYASGLTRRGLLQGAGAAGALALTAGLSAPRSARGQDRPSPKLLIVLCASGGASIIDSALAIRASEAGDADTLNCFPDAWVESFGDLRAVNAEASSLGPIPMPVSSDQAAFVRKHQQDMMVATWTRTSVNHAVGEYRAVSGNDAWQGRTLQEAVANAYGQDMLLPNVHLLTGTGFTNRGNDRSLPAWAYGETVAHPGLWPLSLDGVKGISGAPSRRLVDVARRARDSRFDPATRFARVFGQSERLKRWQHLRGDPQRAIEAEDLISKLMIFPDGGDYPLSSYGLSPSPYGDQVRARFPEYDSDPLQAQAALAFLLLKYRLTASVTLGPSLNLAVAEGVDLAGQYGAGGGGTPGGGGGGGAALPEGSIKNPPIGFDFSHQGHRSVQALMWDRVYGVADGLIELLKGEEYANGESLWDHSMIYVASDFGRSKTRPAGAEEFGTGHHLNNGVVVLSPRANGGKVLGGVDTGTGLTYGFDPATGAPDTGRQMEEKEIYAGLLHTLGVDTSGSGLPDMAAMRRG